MGKHKGKKRPFKSTSKDDFPVLTKQMFSKQLFVVLEQLPDSVVASLTQPRGNHEVSSGEECADNVVENEEICANSTNDHTKASNNNHNLIANNVEIEKIYAHSTNDNSKVSNDHVNSSADSVGNEEMCTDEIEEKDQQNNRSAENEEMYENSVLITEELDIKEELLDDDYFYGCYSSFLPAIHTYDSEQPTKITIVNHSEQPEEKKISEIFTYKEVEFLEQQLGPLEKFDIRPNISDQLVKNQNVVSVSRKRQLEPTFCSQNSNQTVFEPIEQVQIDQATCSKSSSSKQAIFEPPEKVQIVHVRSSQTSKFELIVQNDNSNQGTCPKSASSKLVEPTIQNVSFDQATCSQPSSSKLIEPTIQNEHGTSSKQTEPTTDTVHKKITRLEHNCSICQAFKSNSFSSEQLIPCYRCHKHTYIKSFFNHLVEFHDVKNNRQHLKFCRFMKQETIYCYECYLCGELNIGLTNLKNHVRAKHQHCNICEKIIYPVLDDRHFLLTHTNFNNILTCSTPSCRVEFSSEEEMFNHYMYPTHTLKDTVVLKSPRIDGFECPYCFYTTSCMKVLTFHLRFHIRRRCPVCNTNYIPSLRHVAKFTINQKCGMCSGWGLPQTVNEPTNKNKNLCEIEFDEIESEMKALKKYKSNTPIENVNSDKMDSNIEDQSSSLQEEMNSSEGVQNSEVPTMSLKMLAQKYPNAIFNWASIGNTPATANKVVAILAKLPTRNPIEAVKLCENPPKLQKVAMPVHHPTSTAIRNPNVTNEAVKLCENLPKLQNIATSVLHATTTTTRNPNVSNEAVKLSEILPESQKITNCTTQKTANISVAKGSNVQAISLVDLLCKNPRSQKLICIPKELITTTLQTNTSKQTTKQQANTSLELISESNPHKNVLKLGDKLFKLINCQNAASKPSAGVRLQNALTNIVQMNSSTESNSIQQTNSSKKVSTGIPQVQIVNNFLPRKAGSSNVSHPSKRVPVMRKKLPSYTQKMINHTVQRTSNNSKSSTELTKIQNGVQNSSQSKGNDSSTSKISVTLELNDKIPVVQKGANPLKTYLIPRKACRSTAKTNTDVEMVSSTDPLELGEKIPEIQKGAKVPRKNNNSAAKTNVVEMSFRTDLIELNDKISEIQNVPPVPNKAHGSTVQNPNVETIDLADPPELMLDVQNDLHSSAQVEVTPSEVVENSNENVPETCDDSSNSSIEILDTSETAKSTTASPTYCSLCTLRHSEFGRCYTSILSQQENSIRNEFQKKAYLNRFLNKLQHFRQFIHQREIFKTLNAKSYAGYRAMFYGLFEDEDSLHKVIQCYKCCSKVHLLSLYDHLIDEHLMDENCWVEIKDYVQKLTKPAANTYRCLLCVTTNLSGLKQLTEHVGTHLCRICRCKTNGSSSSKLHVSKHENEFQNVYFCHICKFEFNMEDSFKSHITHFHKIFMLQSQQPKLTTSHDCPYCHFHSDSIIVIEFHLSQHNIATCSNCSSIHIPNAKHVYNSNHEMCMKCESMKGLEKFEHPPPTLKNGLPCLFCTNLYRDDLELFSHMVNTHMVCLICKFLCKSVDSFNRHMVTKHGTVHYNCSKCLKLIANKQDLLVHCKEDHPDIKDMDFTEVMNYTPTFEVNKQCPYCLRLYKRQAQLSQHMERVHSVLQCEVCTMFYFLRTGCMNCKPPSK